MYTIQCRHCGGDIGHVVEKRNFYLVPNPSAPGDARAAHFLLSEKYAQGGPFHCPACDGLLQVNSSYLNKPRTEA